MAPFAAGGCMMTLVVIASGRAGSIGPCMTSVFSTWISPGILNGAGRSSIVASWARCAIRYRKVMGSASPSKPNAAR